MFLRLQLYCTSISLEDKVISRISWCWSKPVSYLFSTRFRRRLLTLEDRRLTTARSSTTELSWLCTLGACY